MTGLQTINCSHNEIISLDHLPAKLQQLFCSHNEITSLDNLPAGLQQLSCEPLNMPESILQHKPARSSSRRVYKKVANR